ncbi:uncharacterized protein DFL_008718 [Arthrobotrys flagrans]|uniref:Uncharacterized protein n=1 Tax=Arthrobotrys flagrans TaxID=97331 RepID=A0A436ZPL2_ARTFL|nr:hypothetical protein DFL_008718 [Arthrobotrys flagrans]
MNIKAFFEVTPLEQWSVTELRKWLRTSTSPLPAKIPRMFQQELQNIREKIEPYTDAPQEWRSKAARLLPGPPNPKFRRRKVSPSVNASHGSTIILNSNNVSVTTAGSSTGPDSTQQQDRSNVPPQLFVSKSPDLALPSGTTFRTQLKTLVSEPSHTLLQSLVAEIGQNIIFMQHLTPYFVKTDIDALRPLLPPLPILPANFREYLDALQPFTCQTFGVTISPPSSATATRENFKMWLYISGAHTHFHFHFFYLTKTSPQAGEAWAGMNLWSRIIDGAYLGSPWIFLNRSEIVSTFCDNKKCDGIMRSFAAPLCPGRPEYNRLEFGFIEVKPHRIPYPADHHKDHQKLIELMKDALIAIKALVPDAAMKTVVVIGILCSGMHMRIYRACNSYGDFSFYVENQLELTLDTLPLILETSWRAMMCIEQTYRKVVDAVNAQMSIDNPI